MLLMHLQCMTHVEKGKFLCKLASQWPENKLDSFSEDYRNCYVTWTATPSASFEMLLVMQRCKSSLHNS